MTEKKTKRVQIRLTDEVYRRLRVISDDDGCTMTQVITRLINDYYMDAILFPNEEISSLDLSYFSLPDLI